MIALVRRLLTRSAAARRPRVTDPEVQEARRRLDHVTERLRALTIDLDLIDIFQEPR